MNEGAVMEEEEQVQEHEPDLVRRKDYGSLTVDCNDMNGCTFPDDFPSNEFIVSTILKDEITNNKPLITTSSQTSNYYQRLVRKALLLKYDSEFPELMKQTKAKKAEQQIQDSSSNQEQEEAIKTPAENNGIEEDSLIDSRWLYICQLILKGNDSVTSTIIPDELVEFIKTDGKSNNRTLQWTMFHCQPACQFQLHAHPNIEIIICLSGELHELRMTGQPITRCFEELKKNKVPIDKSDQQHETEGDESNDNSQQPVLKGPDLTNVTRSWEFHTLQTGQCLINEVGSIHKSFTSTTGSGCVLLTLWGGSHANISTTNEPISFDVSNHVNSIDQKIATNDIPTCCTNKNNKNWEAISSTFLPESEIIHYEKDRF